MNSPTTQSNTTESKQFNAEREFINIKNMILMIGELVALNFRGIVNKLDG